LKTKSLAAVVLLWALSPLPVVFAASPPNITSQPQSTNVLAGLNATFKVTATGSPTPAYQWFFNGTKLTNGTHIGGATGATLTVSNVTFPDAGNYQVILTNSRGSATSSVAVLKVLFTNHLHYVNLNSSNPLPPYGDWSTAATNIQDAIDIANPGDSIFVTNGVYRFGNRVTSTTTNVVVAALPVSVIGVSGPVQTIIDGGWSKRCIWLTNGSTLSGFTVSNGYTIEINGGGGVYCASTNVFLTNCVITVNNGGTYGGGVFQGTLSACVISWNQSAAGGASYSILTNCVLLGNQSVFGAGATYSTLLNCTLVSNTASQYGGAAVGSTLDGCLLSGNTAGILHGGGVYSCFLTNCTVVANNAGQSGGGAMFSTLYDCTLAGNSANSYQGGGVDNCTLYGCILSNNTAGQWGGNASESTLYDCWLTGGSAYLGGGARTSTLVGCVLSNNVAIYGQGGGAQASTLTNCVLVGNVSWYTGGGADASTLVNSLILSNTSPMGGGVNGCSVTNCVLIGNTAYDPYWGGAGGASGSSLVNCLLAGNASVLGAGGAMQSSLVNCTVTGNSAEGDGGGVDSSALTNCIVYFNTSSGNGNYSGTNYMSWCQSTPLPTAGGSDVVIGVSNISSAPVFADTAGGNYRLYPGSPGINAGKNSAALGSKDLDGNPRIVNATVDLGAYEFQNFPFIEIQPVSQTVPFGQPSVSFSVFAVGPGTLTYQWLFNGTNMSGKTNSTLTLTFVQYNQAGNYSVVVANSSGAAVSSNAVLTVVPPTPPSFVSQPVTNLTVPVGTNVLLAVTVTGAPPPAYLWFFNGAALSDNSHYSGTTNFTLQVLNVQTNDSGNYFVVATNTGGPATSSVAAVTVMMPPAITLPPGSQTVLQGSNVTFNAAAAGSAPLGYQWLFNGNPLADGGGGATATVSGSTTTNLAISNLQFTNGGNYALVVTNPVGSITSTAAVLTVIAPPAIVRQPADQSSQLGASAIFNVVAIGTAPLKYQWSLNGADLDGATNSILLLNNLQAAQAGNYAVTISNVVGSVTSSNAELTVNLPPPGVPFITGFSPLKAFPGATVAIFGTNFSSIANSNIVYFGAVRATVTSASVTNLVVTVPVGATLAPITETVGGLTAFSTALFLPTFPGDGTPVNSSTFAPRQNLSTPAGPIATVIADLDGDGKPDLVVANDYTHSISLFRNIGAVGALSPGSFAARVDLPAFAGGNDNPIGMSVADADGDGRPDILVCDRFQNRILIYRNNSTAGILTSGSFAAPAAVGTGSDPRHVRLADLDGDGRPDLVVANYGENSLSVLQNTSTPGSLSFVSSALLAAENGVYDVTLADLDGDGQPDIAAANTAAPFISVWRNLGSPGVFSFASKTNFPALNNGEPIIALDVDGDGKRDLAAGSIQGDAMSVLRNQSVPGTLSFATHVDFGAPGWVHNVTAGDINGDGRPDPVIDGELNSYLAVFQNGGTPGGFDAGSLSNRVDFATGWNAWGVSVGDLDGDGRPDIVLGNFYDGNISIYQNQQPFGGPPVIIAQPANLTAPLNNLAQLSGKGIGQLPLGYQWFFNGTNLVDDGRIAGSLTGTLSISNALLSDSGNYWFVVTNSFGATTSAVASVSVVILPPAFVPPLQNQAAIIGSNAVFSANVGGSLPMALQWFSDNGMLSDDGHFSGTATGALAIAGVQTNDAINYWLVASNAASSATSSVVHLTVVFPVFITQQPSNETNAAGSTFALTVAADGSGPFGYQWYFNNALLADNSRISGSAAGTLIVSNALTSDTGNYTVVATNLLTAATSSVATVTVLTPPGVTTQPLGRSTPLGFTNIFAASGSGTGPLLYQWRLNGADLPGATNTSYFITATGVNDLGVYQFVVSNAVGVAVSSNALLTVGPVAAWGYNFYNQCLVPPGLSNVTTIGNGYSYSLASRLDGTIAAWGSVGSSITNSGMTNVMAISAGVNGALVLRADGSVGGSISINPDSAKVYLSNAVAVAAGGGFGLGLRAEGSVVAWGSGQLSGFVPLTPPPGLTHVTAIAAGYQHAMALKSDGTVVAWGLSVATNVPIGLSNVVAIAGGQTHSLALKSDGTLVAWGTGAGTNIPAGLSNVMAIAAGGYPDQRSDVSIAVKSNGTVVAWGLTGSNSQTNPPAGLTNVVAATINGNHALALVNDGRPQILRQPVGGVAWSGRDWKLQSVAAGAGVLNFQWLLNGTNVPGATSTSLLLPAITSGDAGRYQVVVSNSLGVATSLAAPLTVLDSRPFFLTQPATNLSVYLGSRVELATAIAGSGPLQLQWQFNSNNVPGATNDTLFFDRIHQTNAGYFALIASNSLGAITSAVVKLTVQQVVNWGDNTQGATNMPANLTNVAAISANFLGDMALRADGTITIWGNSQSVPTNTAAGISNVVEVSAGYLYDLVLRTDGRPFAWGGNASPVFSNTVVAQSNIVAIAAGNFTCALLKNDGTVVRVNGGGVASVVSGLTNAISVEPFDDGLIALKADGTVFSQLGGSSPPATLSNVLAIASSRYQGLAVKRDGRVQDWPQTLLPAGTSNIIAVAAGGFSAGPEFAVRADGSIITGGSSVATNVPYGLAKVWRLDAGNTHCLALLVDRDFPPVFLHNALNTSSYVVSSKGAPQWFGQANISHDGASAAQSAPIGNNLSSSMRLWIGGPITVQFWWKVSSAANHGVLSFSASGVVLTNISGEVDWQQCTVIVPAGNQILQWTYAKDGAAAAGQDAGWVDQLQLIPQPPVISTQPVSQNVVGPTNVVLNVGVTGTPPLTFRWWKDGSLVPGANAASLVLLNAVRTNSGTYRVVVTNAASTANSVTSSNAVLDVRVPQLLGSPAFQPDGSILLSATDVGGGQLTSADLVNLQVQVSTNLVDWLTLPNALVLTNGAIQLQDAGTTNSPMRFYRILENW
jgi:alpha-tubulin suppressor-like RCC1 family protein